MGKEWLKARQEIEPSTNVSDLDCDDIRKEDIDTVKDLQKSLRIINIITCIGLALVAVIFIVALAVLVIMSKGKLPLGFSVLYLLTISGIIYFINKSFKQASALNLFNYKKAQYGTVYSTSKYTSVGKNSKGNLVTSTHYYITLYIEKRDCYYVSQVLNRKTWKQLVEGAPALVVSFDGKRTYALPANVQKHI